MKRCSIQSCCCRDWAWMKAAKAIFLDLCALRALISTRRSSILARHEFVTRLGAFEKQFGMVFPRGASAAVDTAAKEFISKHGVENLPKVAKMHFRTALRAQGLPEPPKVEWRKR